MIDVGLWESGGGANSLSKLLPNANHHGAPQCQEHHVFHLFWVINGLSTALRAAENTESLPFLSLDITIMSLLRWKPSPIHEITAACKICTCRPELCYNEMAMHQKGLNHSFCLTEGRMFDSISPHSGASPGGKKNSFLVPPQILMFPICCFCTAANLTGATWGGR